MNLEASVMADLNKDILSKSCLTHLEAEKIKRQ